MRTALDASLQRGAQGRRGVRSAPALCCYVTWGRRVKDAAPYRGTLPDAHRTTGDQPGRRVYAGSTDSPLGYAAQWQRAGGRLSVRGRPAPVQLLLASESSSPVKWGPGCSDYGQAKSISKWMWPVHRSKPRRFFGGFLIAQKATRRPLAAKYPHEIKYTGR